MIWMEKDDRPRDALVTYLLGQMEGMDSGHDAVTEEVACGVAAFWREQFKGQALSASQVACFLSFALRGVGADEAAVRLAEREGAREWLFRAGRSSWATWRQLTAGIFRPMSWAGDASFGWLADLTKIKGLPSAPVELLWFPLLAALLAGMAELWDDSKGQGTLGLRGACPAELDHRERMRWRRNARRFCEALLTRLAWRREWKTIPCLVFL